MKDELETLSDGKLSEVFAVEVAGWRRDEPTGWFWDDDGHLKAPAFLKAPVFATSANAVLPWLDKHQDVHIEKCLIHGVSCSRLAWFVSAGRNGVIAGHAPTFARAACIALIRAKREAKSP